MWRFQLMRCSTSCILPWATEKSWEAGAALNMLGTLHWLDNAEKRFCRYILPGKFGMRFCGLVISPWSSLSAFRFGMAIWNDWKRKLSRQEVTHMSGNGTERYDWSAGLKHEHRLAVAQPKPQKRYTRNWLLAHLMPTRTQENDLFLFFGRT